MSQQATSSIDIGKYRGTKSPIIPTCLRICGDEILTRTQTGQLRLVPSSWSSLYTRSTIFRDKKPDEVQALLDRLGAERKYTTVSKEDVPLSVHCMTLPTEKVFAAFLEYLLRCRHTLNVRLTYPSLGWVIMGPAYHIPFELVDEAHYSREISNLLDSLFEQSPVKRDMLCYIMALVSDLIQTANVAYREQPSFLSIVRYQMCHLLGPILFSIACENCKGVLTDGSRPCDVCAIVMDMLQDPYPVDIMDRMLRHLKADFWKSCMNVNRTGTFTPNNPTQVQQEIMAMFATKAGGRPRPRTEQPMQALPNLSKRNRQPEGGIQALPSNPPDLDTGQVTPAVQPTEAPQAVPVARRGSKIASTTVLPTPITPNSVQPLTAQRSSQRISRRMSSENPLQRQEDRIQNGRTPSLHKQKSDKRRTPKKKKSATPTARKSRTARSQSTNQISRVKHQKQKNRTGRKASSRSP